MIKLSFALNVVEKKEKAKTKQNKKKKRKYNLIQKWL